MRRIAALGTALALALIVFAGPGRSAEPSAPRFAPADLVEDFRIARAALEEGHPGIHRFTSKAELDRVFDAAEKRLDRPMDAWEFYRVLQPAVAALHCGHTSALLPESLQKAVNQTLPLLPLQVRIVERHVIVYRDVGSPDRHLGGREILAVNRIPIDRILDTFYAGLPHDGDVTTSHAWRLAGWRFGGNLQRYFGLASPFRVDLTDGSGRGETILLAGRTVPELDSALAFRYPEDVVPARLGELEFLDGGAIARLKIRQFAGSVDDSGKVSMGDFIRQSFDAIEKRGSRNLILDLRDNGGGADELGKLLLSHLIAEPFDYYDDLVLNARTFTFANHAQIDSIPAELVERRPDGKYHCIGHPNWGRQPPASPRFTGRVFILENGGSYSTTCEFMSHARDLGRATFIGEESGGSYVGNTSGFGAMLTLPHTGSQVRIPLMRYDLAVKPSPQWRRGILPDVPVVYTAADWVAGTDKELAVALERARRP